MITRRRFVSLLAGAAAVTLIGELPSSKTFFLPPAGGWQPSDLSWEAQGRKIMEALNRSLIYTKMDAAESQNFRQFIRSRLEDTQDLHIGVHKRYSMTFPYREPDPSLSALLRHIDDHARLITAPPAPEVRVYQPTYRHSIFEQIWHKRRSVPV